MYSNMSTDEKTRKGGSNVRNIDVRVIVSESGLTYKRIAEKMGVSRGWLSNLMRYDLTPANRERIMKAVRELSRDQEQ